MKKISLLISSALLSLTTIAQGPIDGYFKGKGKLDIGLGYTSDKGTDYYAGTNLAGFSRDITSYSMFAIYGVSKELDVQVNVPYIINGPEKDFQDASIYLKYRAFSKKNSLGFLSVAPAVGFYQPLSKYQTNGFNALGQNNTAVDMRLVAQQKFSNGLFTALQGGYFLKSNPTPDAYSGALKVGYAAGKFYTDAWFELNQAIGGTDYRGTGDKAPTAARGGFKGMGYGYTKIGLTGYYSIINQLGVYVGVASTLSGRNADKSNRFSVGIVVKPFN